jgi:hypothetical protein
MADINGTSGNDILQPYSSSLVLTLSASAAEGIWPLLNVVINGTTVVSNVSITANNATGATQQVTVPVPAGVNVSSLSLQYSNDEQNASSYGIEDRNLYITSITLNGTPIPASAATYVRSADGSVVAGQNAMVWGGSLNFSGSVLNVPAPATGPVSIDGGAGTDLVMFSGARSQFSVSATSTGITVAKPGTTETATLTNVERLGFNDVKLAFDTAGNAGTAVKIIGTLFGPSAATHDTIVGIGISLLDSGMSSTQLAQVAAQTPLFTALAGSQSNADFVKLVFRNVVGTDPNAQQLSQFTSVLDSGQFTKGSFGVAASQLIDLTGVMQNGIEYI